MGRASSGKNPLSRFPAPPLFSGSFHLADGRPTTLTLGDAAQTQRTYCYDVNQRTISVQTFRAAPSIWSSPPPGYTPPTGSDFTDQLSLEHSDFTYDVVGNIIGIQDVRNSSEWPTSAKPLDRTFEYDDLYRLKRATYDVAGGGTDAWTSPYAAENASSTRVPQPSPHVSFANRIQEQEFAYDWLGNPEQTTDDQHGFWDRSLGGTTRGAASSGPHRITAASNRTLAPSSTRKGDLSIAYDDAGNMTDLIVRRDGTCVPSTATSCWQRFRYEWNEVGELSRARRWDLTSAEQTGTENDIEEDPPARSANAEIVYTYGPGGDRVLKTSGTKHTVYIFGSLELRNTTWDSGASTPDYVFDSSVIQLRLAAGPATARILYATESLPTLTSGQQHVFLEMGDHLGSTSFIIEHATGELVEFATYQAYGAAESDFRPTRWAAFREPLRHSGKEEDIELGLAYFGARYYSPYLNVWLSPDPVTIHELGSDMNPYAYVYGTPLMGVDPDGRNPILIGIAIAVAVNIVQQHATTGQINWGWNGVLGAAVIGAVSGGVSMGVSSVIAGSITSSMTAAQATAIQIGAAAAGGVYGAAAAQAASFVITGQSEGSGAAIVAGGVGGLAGGAVGSAAGGSTGGNVASAFAGTVAGFGANGAMGGDASSLSLFLSIGAGTAAALANSSEGSLKSTTGGPLDAHEKSRPPIFWQEEKPTSIRGTPGGPTFVDKAPDKLRYLVDDRGWYALQRIPEKYVRVLQPLFERFGVDVRKIWVIVKPMSAGTAGTHSFQPNVVGLSTNVVGTFDRNICSVLAHEITHTVQLRLLGLEALADFRYWESRSWGEKGQYEVGAQWLESQRIQNISPVTGAASLEATARRFANEVWDNWKGPN